MFRNRFIASRTPTPASPACRPLSPPPDPTPSSPPPPPPCLSFQMPPPTFLLSRNAVLLVAVVERHRSLHIKHAITPNHPPHHPQVLAAHAALITAPDFIFPSGLPSPKVLQSKPSPQHAPISSHVYLPLSEPASDANLSSFGLPAKSKSSFQGMSRTFSNLSSSNTISPTTPTILRRPTSSPHRHSSLGVSPPVPSATLKSPPSSSSPDAIVLDHESCCTSLESKRRQFRNTLLSAATHVFAITAQDGSRNYAFCRPLSSSHTVVVVTALSHTAVYVSALERTAATYAQLVDDSLSAPTTHIYPSRNPSKPNCMCSSFVTDNIMRCPPAIAKKLTETLITWVNTCSLPSSQDLVSNQFNPSSSISNITLATSRIGQHQIHVPVADAEDDFGQCLTSSASSSPHSASDSRNPRDAPDPVVMWDSLQQDESLPLWNAEVHTSVDATTSSNDRNTTSFPWEVPVDAPKSHSISAERIIELADSTLLLRHFTVRALISLIVALLEERRVCLVGPNTAVVSRAVLALDNLVRPFKWPHTTSPILPAHRVPVLGAPFPYLAGILEDHFPATKELPLDNVVFGDISSGKTTSVEAPGELYRHIPRRIRSRLERRLTRAKIACTRQILRSRSMLFSPSGSNTATSIIEVEEHEEIGKREKPSLLKRSRSFIRNNEVVPHNIWLDHETAAGIDKAMRKFFAELLDGFLDVRDINYYGNFDLESRPEGFNPFLFQTKSSSGMSLSSSKRDSEKRQLAVLFQRTQMFMQWEDEGTCDPSFGLGRLETEAQPGIVSRKRSEDKDTSSQLKKGSLDADEYSMKSPKLKSRLTSDLDDAFSGDDGPAGEHGVMRKRFRSKRKLGRRQGVRVHSSADLVKDELTVQNVGSTGDHNPSKVAYLSATEMSISGDQITNSERETEGELEVPARRAWLSLRLPSSPWNTAREWTTFAGREGDTGSEVCEASDEGEETDPFDEVEENGDITDMFPMENVGMSWTRMRQWSRRKNRNWARV